MSGTLIQHWQFLYACAAVLVAVAAFAVAGRMSAEEAPGLPTRCAAAVIAGALWPVVGIGLVQLGVVRRVSRPRQATTAPVPGASATGRTWVAAASY